jgi:hypothetical protein
MAKKRNDRPSDLASDIRNAIREGTKKWTRTRKAEERNPASRSYRRARMTRERGVSLKDAAAQIMPAAYSKVSGGESKLPANARQIMYAARGHIQKATGRQLDDQYFCQHLLPAYIEENGITDWDVVYDARGHFTEPHDGNETFGLGTIEVRDYLAKLHDPSIVDAKLDQAKVKTSGPAGNFGAVLFIEKEGFLPLMESVRMAEKHDIAIMSTKGMSVTAARALVDQICAEHDIPLLLLRDYDKSGFSIAGTLQRDTRRYQFQNSIKVINLGLGLADVQRMRLESEYQHHPKGKKSALIANLRKNGATEQDIAFMFRDFDELQSTRRVELNAMTSPQFVAFVERKLKEHGIAKIIPHKKLLAKVCTGLERGRRLEQAIARLTPDMKGYKPPDDLEGRIRKLLKKNPHIRWDAALAMIVAPDKGKQEGASEEVSKQSRGSTNKRDAKKQGPKRAITDLLPKEYLDAVNAVLGDSYLDLTRGDGGDRPSRKEKAKSGGRPGVEIHQGDIHTIRSLKTGADTPSREELSLKRGMARAKKLAELGRSKCKKLVEELKAEGKDVTSDAVLALARKKAKPAKTEEDEEL